MNITRIIYSILILLMMSAVARAQPDSLTTPRGAVGADTTKPRFEVVPWLHNHGSHVKPISSDSTLRWQIWPDWTHKKNRDPGAFTFRLGTVGRTSSFMIDAHEPRHQELYWEDINLNDPVSGVINWNLLPKRKLRWVYEENSGIRHQTSFYLRQYYVNKPLTKLIFNESKFRYRDLEFFYTQNFSQKTNLELSYWYRTGGDEYPNSLFKGWQLFSRLYHQLDHKHLLKISFLVNNHDLEQPFGYQIPDLQLFNFNRFTTSPVEPGAESKTTASTLGIQFYKRKKDTVAIPEDLRAGLFLNNRKRDLSYSADSTFYQVRSAGANLHKWWRYDPMKLELRAAYERFFNKEGSRSNVMLSDWGLLKSNAILTFSPARYFELYADAAYRTRSDGKKAYQLGSGIILKIPSFADLTVHASTGERMPTVQQLYWNSTEFSGNPDLSNEEIRAIDADLKIKPFPQLHLGLRGQVKDIENAPVVGIDSIFTTVQKYRSVSSAAYFGFDGKNLELSGSANIQQYRDVNFGPSTAADFPAERIWFKGAAYAKGYMFDRAAYIKFGVAGMWAPRAYQAEHYNPVLDFWQPSGSDQLIPSFNRMDVDISARVRSLMFVMRVENVLNTVNQLGFFETAGYPMPRRRFIFGVRARFSN